MFDSVSFPIQQKFEWRLEQKIIFSHSLCESHSILGKKRKGRSNQYQNAINNGCTTTGGYNIYLVYFWREYSRSNRESWRERERIDRKKERQDEKGREKGMRVSSWEI